MHLSQLLRKHKHTIMRRMLSTLLAMIVGVCLREYVREMLPQNAIPWILGLSILGLLFLELVPLATQHHLRSQIRLCVDRTELSKNRQLIQSKPIAMNESIGYSLSVGVKNDATPTQLDGVRIRLTIPRRLSVTVPAGWEETFGQHETHIHYNFLNTKIPHGVREWAGNEPITLGIVDKQDFYRIRYSIVAYNLKKIERDFRLKCLPL